MQQLRGNNKKPTLVFTKSCGTAEFLHGFLTENNIDNLILHGKMNALVSSLCYVPSCSY